MSNLDDGLGGGGVDEVVAGLDEGLGGCGLLAEDGEDWSREAFTDEDWAWLVAEEGRGDGSKNTCFWHLNQLRECWEHGTDLLGHWGWHWEMISEKSIDKLVLIF